MIASSREHSADADATTGTQEPPAMSFKYAGFSGPHPSLVVACPTCLSPPAHYCNGDDGRPTDRPHDDRRDAAAKSREQKP